VSAINEHFVKFKRSFDPTAAETLRISCLESVRSVIFESRVISQQLPREVKLSLKQKGWDFLPIWLSALDDEETGYRALYAQLEPEIKREWEIANTAMLTSQSMLEKLEEDCSEVSSNTNL